MTLIRRILNYHVRLHVSNKKCNDIFPAEKIYNYFRFQQFISPTEQVKLYLFYYYHHYDYMYICYHVRSIDSICAKIFRNSVLDDDVVTDSFCTFSIYDDDLTLIIYLHFIDSRAY